MLHIPAGEEGMLVVFGGWISSLDIQHDPPQADMSAIGVYDIATHTWWNQTATGDVPSPRSGMCSVVSTVADETGFNIAMFGGYHDGGAFGDLYILSLPSFTWIGTDAQDPQQGAGQSLGQASMGCGMYRNTEMIMFGG
jgi:hypothetical protein